jgi:hypothetical protein
VGNDGATKSGLTAMLSTCARNYALQIMSNNESNNYKNTVRVISKIYNAKEAINMDI